MKKLIRQKRVVLKSFLQIEKVAHGLKVNVRSANIVVIAYLQIE